ncbi:MAG: hypothetical protein IPI64_00200 [Chloracidobacterium sp.]|nr:hypothetical protein [Chloracidobacterium sp.]
MKTYRRIARQMSFFYFILIAGTMLAATLLLSLNVYATSQRPNRIYFDGKKYDLCTDPMEEYFKTYPNGKPKIYFRDTSLYRGYLATFETDGGSLFVKDIEANKPRVSGDDSTAEWQSVLADIVPSNERLKVDWVTGLLVAPFGNYRQLDYTEYDCELAYENYLVIEVKDGQVGRSKRLVGFENWMEFQQKQSDAFRKTKEFKDLVKKWRSEGDTDESINSAIKYSILAHSKKILVD